MLSWNRFNHPIQNHMSHLIHLIQNTVVIIFHNHVFPTLSWFFDDPFDRPLDKLLIVHKSVFQYLLYFDICLTILLLILHNLFEQLCVMVCIQIYLPVIKKKNKSKLVKIVFWLFLLCKINDVLVLCFDSKILKVTPIVIFNRFVEVN